MIENFIYFILGIVGLIVGADFLVKGAKNVGEHLCIPHFFIGLAFISIGTSLPEIAIGIMGGINALAGMDVSGIVVGTKVGSATNVIGLLLGLLVILVTIRFHRKQMINHALFMAASVLLFFALALDGFLSRIDGWILIIAYFSYYAYLWYHQPHHEHGSRKDRVEKCKRKDTNKFLVKNITFAFVGIVMLWIFSELVITNGEAIAKIIGVSDVLIGIFLVGIGTGLPELSVLLLAWKRDAIGLSVGDLIGSNICDILFALGAGTVISGFKVSSNILWIDTPVLLMFCLIMLYLFMFKKEISTKHGILLIGLFIAYTIGRFFVPVGYFG